MPNQRKSKEEILDKYMNGGARFELSIKPPILSAMEEYAKQEAIAFEQWKRDRNIVWHGVHSEEWYWSVAGEPLESSPKTPEELYTLFLTTKS